MSFLARILACPPDRFPNPLVADPDFTRLCDAHRGTFREAVRRWRNAYGDEPELAGGPTERAAAAHLSCARACAILAKPEWDRLDLIRLARHYPVAVENEAFRELMDGRWLLTGLAVRAASTHLDAARCLA